MYHITALVLLAALASACPAPAPSSTAQQQPYAQCGGQNFNGGTTCSSGWTCIYSNPWYSQCLPATSSSSSAAAAAPWPVSTAAAAPPPPASSAPAPPPPASTPTAVQTKAVAPSTSAVSTSPAAASSAPASSSGGATYKASFTHYGAGDSFGSPNCQTNTAACGFFTSPGFAAAVSQNLYGAGPGAGAGPACGTCYKLVGETDSSGKALTNAGTSIIVMVNNLCPASGNPLCSQNTLTDTNQYGANVNFDLCSDSGAAAAFFGSDGEGLAVGTATEVSCSGYSGTIVH